MKIQTPPGMRDFYPEDMRLQNWLFDTWRSVSRSFGFEEYEAPIFESLDLYRLKSGDEIVSQLFSFTDRGGREFAIRPEMTPSLARMVAARANALPRPIKWFSIPRMCRAEKPQRGRLREFFQWNIDVLGVEDPLADAEVIAAAMAFFRAAGLGDDEVVMRINHRGVAMGALAALGVPPHDAGTAFGLIDRIERLDPPAFDEAWNRHFGKQLPAEKLREFLATATWETCAELAARAGEGGAAQAETQHNLWRQLSALGVEPACVFDPKIVRGLAYYTGSVFEAHLRAGGLRALCGGGRYDDLTGLLDGPRVPGVGFGMGDAPVLEALRELNRLPDLSAAGGLDVFVIDAEPRAPASQAAQPAASQPPAPQPPAPQPPVPGSTALEPLSPGPGEARSDEPIFDHALRIATQLRQAGLRVDFSYKRTGVGKQLKQASARNARWAVIVGDELRQRGELSVKNLATGEQTSVPAGQLVAWLTAQPSRR